MRQLAFMVMLKLIEPAFKNAVILQLQHLEKILQVYVLINAQAVMNLETLLIFIEDVLLLVPVFRSDMLNL